jgi:hypothetical protein
MEPLLAGAERGGSAGSWVVSRLVLFVSASMREVKADDDAAEAEVADTGGSIGGDADLGSLSRPEGAARVEVGYESAGVGGDDARAPLATRTSLPSASNS